MKCKRMRDKCAVECAFEGEEANCPYFKDKADLEIEYIGVELIEPAPWNRNIGDVGELAASIKAEGVHTPLTVCPHVEGVEGRYTAVAGHRRLAAAKKAGLDKVPCIVRDLSQVESLTMMLSENVQRKAMTPVEEAKAMEQLMLQLPEATAAAVSRATGISKTTVGRRLRIARLPSEAVAGAEERGGTLADYEKIIALTDPAEQERVLRTVGTKDFEREYQKAMTRQEDKLAFQRHIASLEKKGAARLTMEERAARNRELSNVKTIYSWNLKDSSVGKLDRSEQWFYTADERGREIRIYKLIQKPEETAPTVGCADSSPIPAGQGGQKSDADVAKEELEAAVRETAAELDGIGAEASQMDQEFLELRESFVERIMRNTYKAEIMEMAVMAMLYVPWWPPARLDEVGQWLGVEDAADKEAVRRAVRGDPAKALLAVAYCLLEKDAGSWTKKIFCDTTVHTYKPEHQKAEKLELLYRCLETMGYQMSDDELAARDGKWEGYAHADRVLAGFREQKKELERRIYA